MNSSVDLENPGSKDTSEQEVLPVDQDIRQETMAAKKKSEKEKKEEARARNASGGQPGQGQQTRSPMQGATPMDQDEIPPYEESEEEEDTPVKRDDRRWWTPR